MSEIYLSFVIPIYNVEKYIERCLNSIINEQTDLDNYEIVCVNDGSTDNSLQIISDYQQNYSQIKVVNQKNSGVSSARNRGLEASEGEYVMFLDPDDFYAPNSIAPLLRFAIDNNLDALNFGYQRTKNNFLDEQVIDDIKIFNQLDFYKNVLFPPFCWAYIFNKERIGNLRFKEGIIVFEDGLFVESFFFKS